MDAFFVVAADVVYQPVLYFRYMVPEPPEPLPSSNLISKVFGTHTADTVFALVKLVSSGLVTELAVEVDVFHHFAVAVELFRTSV